MVATKPPTTAELVWVDNLKFGATSGEHAIITDGDSIAGQSPMELMACAIAGCMAIDVLSILQKGRHAVVSLRASFIGQRREEPPRRFTSATIHFHVGGNVPDDAVQRAIDLSREKYCSAWSSIRQDVPLTTSFTITRA